MNMLPTLFALGQAIGFKFQDLGERRLQELGVSPLGTFKLYRYAFIPAVLWGVIFVRIEDIFYIIHTPVLLTYFILIAVIWNIQAFLQSYISNTVSSMSALVTLQTLIYLPLLLLVGVFFNNDTPNIFSVLAIVSLLFAFAVQPTQHEKNIRARFSLPIMAIAGLTLLSACLNAVNNGVTREVLEFISPEVFIGVFGVTTIGTCLILTLFLNNSANDKTILQKRRWLALAVPILWFVASIPETYGYAKLPIYTVVSIGAATFALDTFSDLYHRRIHFNIRTAIFIVLTLGGMVLAVFSANVV
jgi:hypothetical protein